MIFPKASLLKLLPSFILLLVITSTCADNTKNSEIQLAQAAPSVKENIVFPENGAIVDVTAPEYGAIPNDGKDDTQAIQKALSRYPRGGKVIYLPNGVYDISDSLHWPPGKRNHTDYKRTTLQGQSRYGVIIRLKNNSPKFQNPKKPRPVISTGFDPDLSRDSEDFKASEVAQRFGNSVRNVTIKVGKNNPGAEGLNFMSNNQGAVRSVKIISEDKKGTTGLALTHGEVGPLLIEDVEIIGFDNGIRTNNGINSITMQDITVREQNKAGIYNGGQVMSLVGFNSINSVPAIINGKKNAHVNDIGSTLTLLNAKMIGRGKAKLLPAISSAGFIYARNVTSSGYRNLLKNYTEKKIDTLNKSTIDEYASLGRISKFSSPSQSLKLPIKPFPKQAWDDPKKWANVEKFGAIGDGKKDDTAAFQAAIDSGATTVFVPRNGEFTINGSLRLRGNVRRFVGAEGWLNGNGEIIADNGNQPTLIVENLFLVYGTKIKWKNIAKRTTVFRSIEGLNLESKGSGDMFIDDATSAKLKFLNPNQSIWARQLNTESPQDTNIENHGAKLWILGLKTEHGKTKIETTNGGFTELLGGFIYAAGKQDAKDPLFRIVNASSSIVGVAEAFFDKDTYDIWVEEIRKNKTKKLMRREIPARRTAGGHVLLLYTGFDELPKKVEAKR